MNRTLSCLRRGLLVSAANFAVLLVIIAQVNEGWVFTLFLCVLVVPLTGLVVLAPIIEVFFRDSSDTTLLAMTLSGTVAGASLGLFLGGFQQISANALFGFLASLLALFLSQRTANADDLSWGPFMKSPRFVALIFMCGIGIYTNQHRSWRALLVETLDIKTLPASVANTKCRAETFMDLDIECAATINPRDFNQLLTHRNYRARKCHGPNNVASLRQLGSAYFDADECYEASLRENEHGLFVVVTTDHSHEHVMTRMSGY